MKNSTNDILIAAVGDILLSDGYFDIGYGMGSQIKKKGSFYPFEKIERYIRNTDILIGNLESPISPNGPKKGLRSKEFLASPLVIEGLKKAGFNILLVANNHVLQHGSEVYRTTIKYLQNADIKPVGHISNIIGSQDIVIHVCKNKKLGFLGYSMAEDKHNTIVNEYAYCNEENKIADEIHKNRNKCDYLILLIHWGKEFVSYPSKQQIELARKFIDEGADAIIGSHSHVLQGIETYKGKTIAYSLGNFVFNMPAAMCRQTAVLFLNILSDGSQRVTLQPVWINRYGRPEVPQQKIFENIEKTIELNLQNLSKVYRGEVEYTKMLNIGLLTHRKWQRRQFMKNINRIDKRYILQMLWEYIRRRISEFRNGVIR